ncbi:nuclear transport factor 2 family protein [Nocardioides sp. Soil796]|uniref:nuclear transport factor 2 family protein n=1 Tax=Nocardioides sp. Soil796 TaxID=1736412 RepID=UPI000A7AA2F3|nr:nuclear transport factor 2 family protein [Nocardioides sp. Soil796]
MSTGLGVEERLRRMEDLHELQQLRAHYCQHLDSGRWDELVELFTPDGAFVGLSTARGRTGLREFFSNLQSGSLSAWWHFSSNETLEVDGDRATGQTWLLQPCVVDRQSQLAAGRYVDTMVRCEDGRWRFEERAVRFFWWSDVEQGWEPGTFVWPPARDAADRPGAGQ